jgi:hypothetical protein
LKVGTVGAIISIVKLAKVAHSPVFGVNVYVKMPGLAVLITAGDQVPGTPLLDVPGREGAESPWQYGPNAENVGTVAGVTVRLSVMILGQLGASGTVSVTPNTDCV